MKRLAFWAAFVAVAAGVFASWSLAQPAETASTASPASVEQAKLPALPAEIKSRQRFIIGVKCDTPPFGYTDVRGQNAGVDVEIARWFARYAFGRAQRVTFVCAPTATREPLLTTNRVDLVISTFTYTADRDTRIDFSRAYYKATGRLLVKNDSPVRTLNDIRGKRVATTTGSVYDRWMKRCFTNTEVVVVESVTAAVIAFNQGRADAVMFDDTSLALVAATDPSRQAHGRPVPRGSVRHRHQAGERPAQALGRLAARADAQEGCLPADHQEQRGAAVRAGVLEEHPAARQHVHVSVCITAERRHRLSVAREMGGGRPAASHSR